MFSCWGWSGAQVLIGHGQLVTLWTTIQHLKLPNYNTTINWSDFAVPYNTCHRITWAIQSPHSTPVGTSLGCNKQFQSKARETWLLWKLKLCSNLSWKLVSYLFCIFLFWLCGCQRSGRATWDLSKKDEGWRLWWNWVSTVPASFQHQHILLPFLRSGWRECLRFESLLQLVRLWPAP